MIDKSNTRNMQSISEELTWGRWTVSPWFLVRMTGFPQELMQGLRFEETKCALAAFPTTPGNSVNRGSEQQMRAIFEEELLNKIAHLRGLASNPRFREAVFLSNPASYPNLERWFDGNVRHRSCNARGPFRRLSISSDSA